MEDNLSHPSVDEIYTAVRQKIPSISKATIYQNLGLLVSEGLIKEVDVKGISRYEPKLPEHHHLICEKCGRIMDFRSDKLTKVLIDMRKDIKGFSVEDQGVNFYGICKECKDDKV